MSLIAVPNTFTAGAVIVASEHNSNFSTIYNDYNGSIVNANISASAAIVDTKLATISTAGKVNFSALTISSMAQGDIFYASSATVVTRLGAGTSGQFLKTQGASANPAWASASSPFDSSLLHVREEQTSGTDGGTFTSGAWRTRTLNTSKTNEISGASLGSNQITLPAGTYFIMASAPAGLVDAHQAKLRNITDSSDILIGTSERESSIADYYYSRSVVNGRFTLAAQKVVELQHQCGTTRATTGFGRQAAFSVTEVYAEVMIWKVA